MGTGLPVEEYPALPRHFRYLEDHRLFLKFNKIIAQASARDLRRRYATALEMLQELEALK